MRSSSVRWALTTERSASTCRARRPQSRGARAFGKVMGWWMVGGGFRLPNASSSGRAGTQGTLQAVSAGVASSPLLLGEHSPRSFSHHRRPAVSLHSTICEGTPQTRVSIRGARAGASHHDIRLVAGRSQDGRGKEERACGEPYLKTARSELEPVEASSSSRAVPRTVFSDEEKLRFEQHTILSPVSRLL